MALRATSDNENLRRSGSPEHLRGTSFPTYNVFSSNEDSSTYRHFRDKSAKLFPALVRRGCPRIARAGAVCSKTTVPINKRSASRVSIRWLRVFEQTTRRCAAPLLTKEGTSSPWKNVDFRKSESLLKNLEPSVAQSQHFCHGLPRAEPHLLPSTSCQTPTRRGSPVLE
jgi:hypothetical protein